jgi:hypothetical protein
MKTKHIVLTVVVAACAAGAYFWVTDSWPFWDEGVKNPEAGQQNHNAKATPSAAPSPTARQTAPTAETVAAPEQTPTRRPDDGLPLFNEREILRVKLEGLEAKVKAIPDQREKAKKETNDGPETKYFKQLMTTSAEDSKSLREEFAGFDKKFAELPQFQAKAPRLTGENVTLASTISDDVKFWAVPLLALSSLLLILTLAQLLNLLSQAKKLHKSNHDLTLDVQRLGKSGAAQEILLKEVKAVAEEQLPSIDTRVSDTKALADSLRESVNHVLERLEVLPSLGAGGGQNSDYDRQSSRQYVGQRDESQSRETAKPHPFPVAVAEYLSLVKDTSSHVKADQFNDVLVEASEDEGDFVLVKDPPAERDGTFYVIPALDYFRRKQDFYNGYYPRYYDCSSQQPVGQVWIKSPAKVKRAGNGWRLTDEKGVLEVQ